MATIPFRAKAWYGDETIHLPVPDRWRLEVSRLTPSRRLAPTEIAAALRSPIGTPTIRPEPRLNRYTAFVHLACFPMARGVSG